MIPTDDLPASIREACEAFEATRAQELAEQLARAIRRSGALYPADQALRALKPLRRKRYFDAALLLGDAIFESGQHEPLVQLVYAQALIDSGRIAAAIPFLERLIASAPARSHVSNEARGLLGRGYKQWYANGGGESAARTNHLVRAFNAYYDTYLENPKLSWHGINAVAILARATEDKLTFPEIESFAKTIYENMRAIVRAGEPTVWDLATAAEAALAVGRDADARKWYNALTRHEGADAFEIASALRQLEEIWRLAEDKPPGSQILPLMRARLLKAKGGGGAVSLRPDELARDMHGQSKTSLEAIFGNEGARAISWYRLGLDRTLPVARIETAAGAPHGTGFVVRGRDFHPKLGEERLVLTNHHVISTEHWKAIRAGDAQLRFHACENAEDRERVHTLEMLWTSATLDATLIRITPEPPEFFKVYPMAEAMPKLADDPKKPTRVYVIGHPLGGEMAVSLYDNSLLDYDQRRLHYRAPTQPGSSGSPVFNDAWQLIGLHHAGDPHMKKLHNKKGDYEANEAFSIHAIRGETKKHTFTPRRSPRPRSSRPSTPAKKSFRRRK